MSSLDEDEVVKRWLDCSQAYEYLARYGAEESKLATYDASKISMAEPYHPTITAHVNEQRDFCRCLHLLLGVTLNVV